MKWVTRERVTVDRVACPWLIKKVADPEAKFLFLPPEQVPEIAGREGVVPYADPVLVLPGTSGHGGRPDRRGRRPG